MRILSYFKALILTLCYRVLYFKNINASLFHFLINGTLVIIKGKIFIKGSFRTRSGVSLNINEGHLFIGSNVFFNRDVSINCRGNMILGDNIMVGEGVKIYDHDHCFSIKEFACDKYIVKDITIGSNVWVGANVIILKGVNVGDNVCIAAGSVVTKSIPSNTTFIQEKVNKYIKHDDLKDV